MALLHNVRLAHDDKQEGTKVSYSNLMSLLVQLSWFVTPLNSYITGT